MKKIFTVVVIFALILAGCGDGDGDNTGNNNNGGNTGGTATLTIKNESSYEIIDVLWNNISFANNQAENSIKPGTSVTKTVQTGNGYIRFKPKSNPISSRTSQLITVEKDRQEEFIFLNNTIVVNENNSSDNGTLSSFSGVAQIMLKQGNTVIAQYGQYNFGSIGSGNTKDITFTIENSGGANLTLETVNGARINLTDNTSGFFSVQQQPLSPAIAPGASASFTIRFNPSTVGNNINAAVNIKTSSYTDGEFVFAVIGDSLGTAIGDTGPGGGFIFSTGGGQYMECSGELGSFNWDTAKTTAKNYKGGGFSDWYLPTIGDLNLMYSNLHVNGLGGFQNASYWSSSSPYYNEPYYKNFSDGSSRTTTSYSSILRVRAVRSFTLD